MTLNPRFTGEEKKILYSLFRQHEDVIDIKNRKNKKGEYSVRDAWQCIVDDFNGHHKVKTHRNLKQIQKFWLNARLRKLYPTKAIKNTKPDSSIPITIKKGAITVPQSIKCKVENSLPTRDSAGTPENIDEYAEVELQGITVSDSISLEPLKDFRDSVRTRHENQKQDKIQKKKHQNTKIQAQQQINVDLISAEKLTLNDLLQFKNARPQEEIILEIKQPDDKSITLPSPNRPTFQQQIIYNEPVGEIKDQSHIQVQHYQGPQQITPQRIQQQCNASNSTYYTYTTQNEPHASTTLSSTENATDTETGNSIGLFVADSFEEKINYFKLKETELRYKEDLLLSEQKRIELSKMQEKLRHKKEMHRLKVEEMQIKIKILCEEEKQLAMKGQTNW